jgi:hypothetical protein
MSSNKQTIVASQQADIAGGNSLFRGASVALGLQGHTARILIMDVLKRAGFTPDKVTVDELGGLLPEIELLVRKLMPPEMVQERLQRLQRFLISVTPEE